MRPKPWQGTGRHAPIFEAARQRYGVEIGERFAVVSAREILRQWQGTPSVGAA